MVPENEVINIRKIAIVNQKGGVAKTTTTINLGAGLSRENKRVLILDLDPQGSVSASLHETSDKDMFDILVTGADPRECITHMGTNLDIITSKDTLMKAELALSKEPGAEKQLKKKLAGLEGYDYVLVDCAPAFNLMTRNALIYSDEAIIPSSTDYLGMIAIRNTMRLIDGLNAAYDHELRVIKIIPTLYDQRNKICKEMHEQMKNEYYELVSDPVRVNSKIKEAPKHGKSIFSYRPNSPGAKDYGALVRAILQDEAVARSRMEPMVQAKDAV